MNKIIIYSDDEQEFISKEIGCCFTRNICQAAEFDTMEEAERYASNNYPATSLTFLRNIS